MVFLAEPDQTGSVVSQRYCHYFVPGRERVQQLQCKVCELSIISISFF